MPAKLRFKAVIDALARQHGEPERAVPRTPLEWVLWENVAYLVSDEKRARAFSQLKKTVGLTAEKIDAADRETLLAVTRLGGMHPEARVDRLKDIASIALDMGGGNLKSLLKLPLPAARKALRRFPSIGAPGADKILLACGSGDGLALESNGLRVLLRLGFGEEAKSYSTTYRSVIEAVGADAGRKGGDFLRAHQLLRAHGQAVCRRTAPDCEACPLEDRCAFARKGVDT
jgi:endonuclease-3